MTHALKNRIGSQTNAWKGMRASYTAKHHWLLDNFTKKGVCEDCGKKSLTHWANISGEYQRDIKDYKELCVSCHKKFDFGFLCKRGHNLSGSNIRTRPDRPNTRICKLCEKMRIKKYINKKHI